MSTIVLDEKKVRAKYHSKKSSTKGRIDKKGNAIEFKLSFDEYYKLYSEFGQYPSQTFVLCRKDDLGHYEAGNVFVSYFMNNLTDSHGLTSELDVKINKYCEKTGYKRSIVKNMIKRGELVL